MAAPPSGVTLQLVGNTLEVHTDTAEAADRVWIERRAWLGLWPASRLLLHWYCPETSVEVKLSYQAPPLQLSGSDRGSLTGALGAAL